MSSLSQYQRDLLDRGVELVAEVLRDSKRGHLSVLFAQHRLTDAMSYLSELQKLLDRDGPPKVRRRKNPPLILLSNPPMPYKGKHGSHGSFQILDVISEEAHAILYRHAEDGEPYRHDFERPTQLLAIVRNGKHDVLITSEDGAPIWQDF